MKYRILYSDGIWGDGLSWDETLRLLHYRFRNGKLRDRRTGAVIYPVRVEAVSSVS